MAGARQDEAAAIAASARADENAEKTRQAHEEGKRVEKSFAELGEAEASLIAVEAGRKDHEKKVDRKSRARAAAPLFPVMEARDEAGKEAAEADQERDRAARALDSARDAARRAAKVLKAEDCRENERQAAAKKVGDLERLLGRIGLLEEARSAAARAQEEHKAGVAHTDRLDPLLLS